MGESKLNIKLTYSSIDGIHQVYSRKTDLLSDRERICFEYMESFVKTGKWPDETPGYDPVIIRLGDREFDALARARWYYYENLERNVIWEIAKRCERDADFASAVVEKTTIAVQNCNDNEKKEWNKAKKLLREHKKKGKSVFGDYCYFVEKFNMCSVLKFEIENNDAV